MERLLNALKAGFQADRCAHHTEDELTIVSFPSGEKITFKPKLPSCPSANSSEGLRSIARNARAHHLRHTKVKIKGDTREEQHAHFLELCSDLDLQEF